MWFMADAIRGDIRAVADRSFDCVMCGLCAARCPQGLVPYNVAMLARRLYGRYLAPVSEHVETRIADIAAGKFDAEIEELKKADKKTLRRKYARRDMEPAHEQQWE
jgi:heterodisulfide reductase subunit C